ncbi:hypothetical protein [Niallia circulans]
MVDNITKEARKKNMKAIRSQSKLENLVSVNFGKEELDLEKM